MDTRLQDPTPPPPPNPPELPNILMVVSEQTFVGYIN